MATLSIVRGVVWRIDFKKKGDFLAKFWAVLPFGDFEENAA